ncbi:unnamed protein product [Ambrosiozyma monospora]|uniref:Unnamed protein product n=1 Tax=Ambrosiozyma monospora TaxID=43982 RepID=A0ACB5SWI0_AMBMO|nr:unnamed protein product [Ambrosiozyma monospora]
MTLDFFPRTVNQSVFSGSLTIWPFLVIFLIYITLLYITRKIGIKCIPSLREMHTLSTISDGTAGTESLKDQARRLPPMPIHYMIDNPSSPMFSIEPIENIKDTRELTARALAYGVMPNIASTEDEIRALIKHRIDYLTEFKQAIYASRSMSSFSPAPSSTPEKQISIPEMKQISDSPTIDGKQSRTPESGIRGINNSEKDSAEITVIMSALLKEIQDFNVKIEKTNEKVNGIEQSISSILISSAAAVSNPAPLHDESKSTLHYISDETSVTSTSDNSIGAADNDDIEATASTGKKDSILSPPHGSSSILEMQKTITKLEEQLEKLTLRVEDIKKTSDSVHLEENQSSE